MPRPCRIVLSTLIRKVPPCKYYFYLEPKYFELQRKIENITQDMVLITVVINCRKVTLLMEYLPDRALRSSTHEQVLELLQNQYIYHYIHLNEKITSEKSMLRWIRDPQDCMQISFYNPIGLNGMLVLVPEEEMHIIPGLEMIDTFKFDPITYEISFKQIKIVLIYNDLKCFGKKRSFFEQCSESICSNTNTKKSVDDIFMEKFYNELEHDEREEGNEKVILRKKMNVLTKPVDGWRTVTLSKFRVQRETVRDTDTERILWYEPIRKDSSLE